MGAGNLVEGSEYGELSKKIKTKKCIIHEYVSFLYTFLLYKLFLAHVVRSNVVADMTHPTIENKKT